MKTTIIAALALICISASAQTNVLEDFLLTNKWSFGDTNSSIYTGPINAICISTNRQYVAHIECDDYSNITNLVIAADYRGTIQVGTSFYTCKDFMKGNLPFTDGQRIKAPPSPACSPAPVEDEPHGP